LSSLWLLGCFLASFGCVMAVFISFTAARVTFVAFIPVICCYLRGFYGLGGFCDPRLVFILLVWLFVFRFRGFSCSCCFSAPISALWADFVALATGFLRFCSLFCFYAQIFVSARVHGVGFIWFFARFCLHGGCLRRSASGETSPCYMEAITGGREMSKNGKIWQYCGGGVLTKRVFRDIITVLNLSRGR